MEEKISPHTVRYTVFVLVWAGLIALTWLTVKVAKTWSGALSVVSPLIIASVKTGLVLAFFMHLKYERRLIKIFCAAGIGIIIITAWLVYSDVLYR